MDRDQIKELQSALTANGYDTKGIDGIAGKNTRTAIEGYQRAKGLPVDGQPSLTLLSALKSGEAAPVRPAKAGDANDGPLPLAWLPSASPRALVIHWTGGPNKVTTLDREHYHFIVGTDLAWVRGDNTIADNANVNDGKYAAHTKGFNTGVVGVSLAGMLNAVEGQTDGPQPIILAQLQEAARAVAQICRHYGIPVTDKTVLTHAEVQPNLGIQQNGKWDITRFPWNDAIKGHRACGDFIRNLVRNS